MTRDEHMAFCKRRAFAYCDHGDARNALNSMFSDLEKHPETANHAGIRLGFQLLLIGALRSPEEARRFIEGFR
jgi:hypothetical protein